jgi:hypothetical protein
MVEWRVHEVLTSISLIKNIKPFRLIEHQIGPIVNLVNGRSRPGKQQQDGYRTPATRDETDTGSP